MVGYVCPDHGQATMLLKISHHLSIVWPQISFDGYNRIERRGHNSNILDCPNCIVVSELNAESAA